MTRAGRVADRKAKWCPSSGRNSANAVWHLYDCIRMRGVCKTCYRVFEIGQDWGDAFRVPRHKRPEDIQDHHRPRNVRLKR